MTHESLFVKIKKYTASTLLYLFAAVAAYSAYKNPNHDISGKVARVESGEGWSQLYLTEHNQGRQKYGDTLEVRVYDTTKIDGIVGKRVGLIGREVDKDSLGYDFRSNRVKSVRDSWR